MCSNASITEILGINDNNLVILGNEKERKLQYQFVHFFCPSCKNIGTCPKIYVKTRPCLFILVLTSILGLVN